MSRTSPPPSPHLSLVPRKPPCGRKAIWLWKAVLTVRGFSAVRETVPLKLWLDGLLAKPWNPPTNAVTKLLILPWNRSFHVQRRKKSSRLWFCELFYLWKLRFSASVSGSRLQGSTDRCPAEWLCLSHTANKTETALLFLMLLRQQTARNTCWTVHRRLEKQPSLYTSNSETGNKTCLT